MAERVEGIDHTTKWIRRIARILSIIVIAFTLFMAIAHIVAPEPNTVDYPPIEILPPVIILLSIAGLAVAWRWEGLGGAINVGLFLVFYAVFWMIRGEPFPFGAVPLMMGAVVPGILFLACWWRERR
jgi:hypothetical protein